MITIIDFGGGNLRSVQKSIEYVGFKAEITSDAEIVRKASHIVFPGNGAFGDCIAGMKKQGLISAVDEFIQKGNPFLGICIGMQALFEKSYEFGVHVGLGYMKGVVKRFPDELINKGMKIPHTGWNSVHFKENHPVFKNIKQDSYFYFVHSFYGECADEKNVQGKTDYGIDFVSAVTYENITGVQFHPEKSQQAGLKLLENFCNL